MDTKELLRLLRKKLRWLEGFGSALRGKPRKAILAFVHDAQHILNKYEEEQ